MSTTTLAKITPDEKRLVKGDRLKFDNEWSNSDGTPAPEKLLVLGLFNAVQCWQDKKIADCVVQSGTEPLPDLDELNGKIPEAEWETGLDGKPKPPWVRVCGLYFCNPQDGSIFTYINSTTGTRIGFEKLKDRIEMMRMLRGANVAPVVKLESKPFKTQFGIRPRPEFTVVNWVGLNGGAAAAPAIEHHKPADPPPLKLMSEPSASEVMDDGIPF
jgi:hypothetical protein